MPARGEHLQLSGGQRGPPCFHGLALLFPSVLHGGQHSPEAAVPSPGTGEAWDALCPWPGQGNSAAKDLSALSLLGHGLRVELARGFYKAAPGPLERWMSSFVLISALPQQLGSSIAAQHKRRKAPGGCSPLQPSKYSHPARTSFFFPQDTNFNFKRENAPGMLSPPSSAHPEKRNADLSLWECTTPAWDVPCSGI